MSSKALSGQILLPQGFVKAKVTFNRHIEQISPSNEDEVYILPGFIDVHVHGGGGGDAMDGEAGLIKLGQFHLRHGVTTLYPTTMTNPWDNITAALKGFKHFRENLASYGLLADMPGMHLEGPFISPKRLGAQPPFTLQPSMKLLDEVLCLGVVRLVTMAPELEGSLEMGEGWARAQTRLSIGHTTASYEQCAHFINQLKPHSIPLGFTHLYNAMSPLTSREPGAVGAALAHNHPDIYAEIIYDTHHVHKASFLSAYHAKKDNLIMISDAMRATGLGDGLSELGGQTVMVKDGLAKLVQADGTLGSLAGSVLTLEVALRNAVEAGLSLEQASRLLSANPARYMGLADRGEIVRGKRADFVVLDKDLQVLRVVTKGQILDI